MDELNALTGSSLQCNVVIQAIKSHETCTEQASLVAQPVVVNLERRPDKWEDFISSSRSVSLDFTRFTAIDGKQLALTVAIRTLFDPRRSEVNNPYEDHGYRRGVLGCALSHLQIWKIFALTNMPNDAVQLVVEDDIVFTENFNQELRSRMEYLLNDPNWDIVYLGFSDYQKLYNDVQVHHGIRAMGQSTRMNGGGTFAYLIRKRAASILLTRAQTRGIRQPIDWFMIDAFSEGAVHAYITDPPLITSTPVQAEGSNTHEGYPLHTAALRCERQERSRDGGAVDSVQFVQPKGGEMVVVDGRLHAKVVLKQGVDVRWFGEKHECCKVCFNITGNGVKQSVCKMLWDTDELYLDPMWFQPIQLPSVFSLQVGFHTEDGQLVVNTISPVIEVTIVPVVTVLVHEKSIVLVVADVSEFNRSHLASIVCFSHQEGSTCFPQSALPIQLQPSNHTSIELIDIDGRQVAEAHLPLMTAWAVSIQSS